MQQYATGKRDDLDYRTARLQRAQRRRGALDHPVEHAPGTRPLQEGRRDRLPLPGPLHTLLSYLSGLGAHRESLPEDASDGLLSAPPSGLRQPRGNRREPGTETPGRHLQRRGRKRWPGTGADARGHGRQPSPGTDPTGAHLPPARPAAHPGRALAEEGTGRRAACCQASPSARRSAPAGAGSCRRRAFRGWPGRAPSTISSCRGFLRLTSRCRPFSPSGMGSTSSLSRKSASSRLEGDPQRQLVLHRQVDPPRLEHPRGVGEAGHVDLLQTAVTVEFGRVGIVAHDRDAVGTQVAQAGKPRYPAPCVAAGGCGCSGRRGKTARRGCGRARTRRSGRCRSRRCARRTGHATRVPAGNSSRSRRA